MDHEFLTVQEVAILLRVSQSTIRNYIRRGLIPSLKLGAGRSAAVRIRRADIDALVSTNKQDDEDPETTD